MPYKPKDRAVWWASYTDPSGQRVRRSTGTTDRKDAEALEHKWKLEAYFQKQWDSPPERSFEDLMVRYLKETQPVKRAAERDLSSTKRLKEVFGGMLITDIGAEGIAEYKRRRREAGVADSTIAKELRLLSAAINHARREWDWQIENPVQGRCPKEPPGRMRWLTKPEASALLAAARRSYTQCLADFIMLGLATGMRSGEILKLEWQRVDLGQRLVYLRPEDQKNHSSGSVPINDTARDVLLSRFRFRQAHCPDIRWVFCHKDGERVQSVKRSFANACKKAEVEDLRIHDLRHTAAAWLVQDGVPLRTVCELLRHKDIATTMRYAHLAPEHVREAVSALEWSRFGHGHQEGEERKDAKCLI